jgi:hypothetical protein
VQPCAAHYWWLNSSSCCCCCSRKDAVVLDTEDAVRLMLMLTYLQGHARLIVGQDRSMFASVC